MTILQYFNKINERFKSGISTEHSYRGEFQLLLESILAEIDVTNEPTRISCGAPDYIITKKGESSVPIGYIEAKDITELDLDAIGNNKQIQRYRASLTNLILTNYIEFIFYRDSEKVARIAIGKIENNSLLPVAENWPAFENLLQDFAQYQGLTIKNAFKLAESMATKAKLMQTVLQSALESDELSQDNSSLKDQMLAFKNILIHDITPGEFADIYAQTIAYGLFAARLQDPDVTNFNRRLAAELIPKSNPFLKKLFGYIAGVDIDDRIVWIVNALAEVFRMVDVLAIVKNFGKATRLEDPMIHFYETFLAAYNPSLRKSRGVWYTPEPVVNFIVRAADDLLQRDFELPLGLADHSKIVIKKKATSKATADKRSKIKEIEIEEEVHKVQILDPATGTGTFLAEVIRQIYSKFEGQYGTWSQYAEENLVPRLNGFELLMASYAMAHLKIDVLLRQTGYKPQKRENRLRIYLTNSLEEAHADTNTLFASWLSQEASEANNIKKDVPVMVIIGNPPYSVSSSNKGDWIKDLLVDYKKGLNEKKQNLDDDYIKFIRYGEFFIDKNGEGILAYISNNSFIDGITHRQMRKHLSETFDEIYILDLHGNSKKKEKDDNGGPDQNVFDIMQGVSINIFVKKRIDRGNALAKVFFAEVKGTRKRKYDFLTLNTIESINWSKLELNAPNFYFTPKKLSDPGQYYDWLSLKDIFIEFNSGVKTDRDPLFIAFDKAEIERRFKILLSDKLEEIFISEYRIEDSGSYKITEKIKKARYSNEYVSKIQYRILDWRYTYYDKRIVSRPAQKAMRHIFQKDNVGLIFKRQAKEEPSGYTNFFISDSLIIDGLFAIDPLGREVIAPLYLYPDIEHLPSLIENHRISNFSSQFINEIALRLNLQFTSEKSDNRTTFSPMDILDYIYAIVHNPTYRKKYAEFLKVDFPRIPYPKDLQQFLKLSAYGSELRQYHLLNHSALNKTSTSYPMPGSNLVEKQEYILDSESADLGKVFINSEQFFGNVPRSAWDFYIGGYQPARKYLKDRKGRLLLYDEIIHFQKVIESLYCTTQIMTQIDTINFE